MWSWVYFLGIIVHNSTVIGLRIEINSFFIPYLNTLNFFIYLCVLINVPVNHIFTIIIGIFCPDFNNTHSIGIFKLEVIITILVTVHITEAFCYRACYCFCQLTCKIIVKHFVKFSLQFRYI